MVVAIKKMKQGKAGGFSGVIVEMIKAAGREIITELMYNRPYEQDHT